jgi:hypothetical protein
MSNNASDGISIALGVVVGIALVFLQSLGKTTIRDDHDLPPVASPRSS